MDLATFQKETKELENAVYGTGSKVREQPYHEKFDTFFDNATEQLQTHVKNLKDLESILEKMCQMFGEPEDKTNQVRNPCRLRSSPLLLGLYQPTLF